MSSAQPSAPEMDATSTEASASRTIYLISYIPSHLFPAHWGLWVPNRSGDKGTLVNVLGDSLNGFQHEFLRDYDPRSDERRPWMRAAAQMDDGHVQDPAQEARVDIAYNELERAALGIPAPAPSMRSASSQAARTRVELKNCQTWLAELVETLIRNQWISESARDVLSQCPKH